MMVNPTRPKELTNIRTHDHDEAVRLTPARRPTLETAIEWIAEDELVEVTPEAIRIRKRYLTESERRLARKGPLSPSPRLAVGRGQHLGDVEHLGAVAGRLAQVHQADGAHRGDAPPHLGQLRHPLQGDAVRLAGEEDLHRPAAAVRGRPGENRFGHRQPGTPQQQARRLDDSLVAGVDAGVVDDHLRRRPSPAALAPSARTSRYDRTSTSKPGTNRG